MPQRVPLLTCARGKEHQSAAYGIVALEAQVGLRDFDEVAVNLPRLAGNGACMQAYVTMAVQAGLSRHGDKPYRVQPACERVARPLSP